MPGQTRSYSFSKNIGCHSIIHKYICAIKPNEMQSRLLLLIILVFVTTSVFSQTFNGSGGPIADDNNYSDFVIDVQGLVPAELTSVHGLSKVCINANHSWISDLDIRLITPDGLNLMLISNKGDD